MGSKFDIVTGIIQNGSLTATPEFEGSTFTITIDNGPKVIATTTTQQQRFIAR